MNIFKRFEDEWLIEADGLYGPGEEIEVTLRSGTKKTVIITDNTCMTADGKEGSYLLSFQDPEPHPTKTAQRTTTPGNKATPKQVSFAWKLIQQGGWIDSDIGQGMREPSLADLRNMSRRDISAIIDDLKF